MVHRLQFYIDGAWVDPAVKKTHPVTNPATEEVMYEIAVGSKADVDKAVAAARRAFETFSQTTREERIASFEREITPLRGVAHMAHTREEAVSKVMALLAEQDSTEILAWDDDQLPIPELGAALRNAGYRVLDATVPRDTTAQRARGVGAACRDE